MRWTLRAADAGAVDQLALEASLTPALARLLVVRGITTADAARHFLSPSLNDLHSPYLLKDMDVAVARLRTALRAREPILLYGDYDVDGTSAVVILKTAIELCGGSCEFHVPHRIREGYGMRDEVIASAAQRGVRLIISVDTGIRAFEAAETAARLGLDLIVTDHHLPQTAEGGDAEIEVDEVDAQIENLTSNRAEAGSSAIVPASLAALNSGSSDQLPQALAVLNPNRADCDYPCKSLCGAAVAFKLAQALMAAELGAARTLRLLPSFLKIVAIATIADSVPLVDENRVFAKLGLAELGKPTSVGLKALLQVAGVDLTRPVRAGDIGFRVAPRINAAGRMDEAAAVVELFTTKNEARAMEIAIRLDQLNAARQQEERKILDDIDGRFAADPSLSESFCIVMDGEGWHRGVIGITASRVLEKYGRPAIVLSRDATDAHGSGRSIDAYHLLEGLESCAGLFSRFGGHAHAVGMALPVENIAALRAALDAHARARLTLADFEPQLEVEANLGLEEITPALGLVLAQMEPYGKGNPEPVFAASDVRLREPLRILKEKHIKLKLEGNGGKPVPALGWSMKAPAMALNLMTGDALDVAFTIEENLHPDFGGLELRLKDLRRASGKY